MVAKQESVHADNTAQDKETNTGLAEDSSGEQRTRQLGGSLGALVRWITIALGVYILLYISTIFQWLDISLYGSHRALTYAVILFLLFVFYPASRKGPWDRVPRYDWVLALLGAFCALYAFVSWNAWLDGVGIPTWYEEIFGILLVLITLEGSRRALGPAFTLVALVFIIYPIAGPYLPGVFATRTNSLSALVQNYYFAGTTDGIFGSPMEIFTTTVAVFLLFGTFLQATGAAKVFLDGAMGIAGAYRAGMAKVAVISSALFGTISGVGVANVLVTGSFTIPAMKRMGYRPPLAAAVEAAASTGGILMPPVMGAAAFLMSDILALPYWNIAVAAFLPGVLYFLALFLIVDFEGGRANLKGVPRAEIPPLSKTLKQGWPLLISVAVLLIALGQYGVPVDQSALLALVVLVVLSMLRPGGLRPAGIAKALEDGGRLLAEIGVTGAVVGIITGGFALTGLGSVLPQAMQSLAGDSLLVLLILAAAAAIILGMGAPPLLVYILLASTVAPALIKVGVTPIAAHMFIFYFGLMSMLTPPVALASMIAARVAGADFWKTSIEACRLAIVAYIVPFFFVYNPALLMQGDLKTLVFSAGSAIIGVTALASGLTRYFFFRPLPLWETALITLGGLLLFYPELKTDLIGLALLAPTLVISALELRNRKQRVTA
jgi:TRAP transporter 4TM/12TM fusion protein